MQQETCEYSAAPKCFIHWKTSSLKKKNVQLAQLLEGPKAFTHTGGQGKAFSHSLRHFGLEFPSPHPSPHSLTGGCAEQREEDEEEEGSPRQGPAGARQRHGGDPPGREEDGDDGARTGAGAVRPDPTPRGGAGSAPGIGSRGLPWSCALCVRRWSEMSFGRTRHPGFCLAWHSLPVPSSAFWFFLWWLRIIRCNWQRPFSSSCKLFLQGN